MPQDVITKTIVNVIVSRATATKRRAIRSGIDLLPAQDCAHVRGCGSSQLDQRCLGMELVEDDDVVEGFERPHRLIEPELGVVVRVAFIERFAVGNRDDDAESRTCCAPQRF